MRVTVQYLAQIRRSLGISSEEVDVAPGCTLAMLLQQLAVRADAGARSTLIDETGRPSRSLLFFVNDVAAGHESPLPDGATITILTPMAGGSPTE